MKIGIISDSHDHLPNLRHALEEILRRGAGAVIHCGDLVAPFVTLELGRFAGPVHTVFGNNDGDRFLSLKLAAETCPNVTHHGEVGVVELDGARIAFSHYEHHARGRARAQGCQVALHGHTHLQAMERDDGLLVLNPGELLGFKGRPSFCTYDTATGEVERVELEPQPWPPGGWS
jgi:hypothetical protein